MKILTLIFGVFVLTACEAPRNNPLDVHNADRKFGALSGRVQSVSLPRQPLEGVYVYSRQDKLMLQTDTDGYFLFNNMLPRNDWIFFSQEGFHSDSVFIDWSEDKSQFKEMYLNEYPVLDSLIFYSSVTNRWADVQILELFVQACIQDADNDIDSVFFDCPKLDFSTSLTYDTIKKLYENKRISMTQLGITSAEELIGYMFDILVKDSFQHQVNIEKVQIQRIIRDEVELKSPAGHEVVSQSPTLRWERITPGYSFTYLVEIHTDEVDKQLVWQKGSLPSGSSSINVDVLLPKAPLNSYIWAVWIIDSFGNRARSKFKSFQVE
jgi:hypothetical protein